ncbi:hypothetical protein CERZMDRAFT_89513 [Cercospora zeae-maydis SCOH1-5]|uniref:Uncharacterized protein n=1 Tax=Cercospora zeae-maydis SCOH1-5 TaxID=717836 RepID=A0A6A6FV88_9PEZI|nr:hypothetical protein CERZMDRAFT_89513 [Cercospora zeae-maydis SCOH1-5]
MPSAGSGTSNDMDNDVLAPARWTGVVSLNDGTRGQWWMGVSLLSTFLSLFPLTVDCDA